MTIDINFLLGLAEVCIAFTGFAGIVLALGHRSEGEWEDADRTRFWTLIATSISPVGLTLLPILVGLDKLVFVGLFVGGASAFAVGRHAYAALGIPEASSTLAVFVMLSILLCFGNFVLCSLGIGPLDLERSYLTLIFWNLSIALLFFVRLLRGYQSAGRR